MKKSYYDCVRAEHLAPLPSFGKNLDDSTSDDDSEIEVTSVFDPEEHELIRMSEYLHVHSDEDDSDEEREQDQFSHRHLVCYSNSDDSTDGFDSTQTRVSPSAHTNPLPSQSTSDPSSFKMKRRQWSIREKVQAMATFEKNGNKYRTCKIHGCSASQLRKWLSVKSELQAILKQRKGQSSFPTCLMNE